MHAWLIRPERFGTPMQAFQQEVVDIPAIADDEVLVYVMAAGINYNNVWAGLGIPVDVIGARNKAFAKGEQGEPEPFHIGGSDASGIVYKVGKDVTSVKVGDEVVIHCGQYSRHCDWVKSGGDPMYSPSFRIWGYETNWGSFAQFTKVQAQQCMPKPRHMTWEEASAYTLVAATAWRMLHGWGVNALKKDDVVLIWGGAGGLGSMAIQIAKAAGHFANTEQSHQMNELALSGQLDPCLSKAFTYAEIPHVHQLMHDNKHPHGNIAVLVGATAFGQGASSPRPAAIPQQPRRSSPTTTVPYPMSAPLPGTTEAITISDDGTQVKDLMHRGIIACGPYDSVAQVAKLMTDQEIHAVVVMDGGKAVGVVSQTDLVLARQGRTLEEARALPAQAIMTPRLCHL